MSGCQMVDGVAVHVIMFREQALSSVSWRSSRFHASWRAFGATWSMPACEEFWALMIIFWSHVNNCGALIWSM